MNTTDAETPLEGEALRHFDRLLDYWRHHLSVDTAGASLEQLLKPCVLRAEQGRGPASASTASSRTVAFAMHFHRDDDFKFAVAMLRYLFQLAKPQIGEFRP